MHGYHQHFYGHYGDLNEGLKSHQHRKPVPVHYQYRCMNLNLIQNYAHDH